MGKFLDKKQQVYDFKLTSYGKHMLSEGTLRPIYYAFFDDNIIYDGTYVNITETQNNIINRIKNETQYLEGQILFEEIEKVTEATHDDTGYIYTDSDGYTSRNITFFNTQTPTKNIPRKDIFRFDQMIGDAFLEGNTQNIPAWKVVALQGQISSSQNNIPSGTLGTKFDIQIPQINIELNYNLKIGSTKELQFTRPDLFNVENDFANLIILDDERYLSLERDDLLIYAEELNTILLNNNFEVEVFEITGSQEGLEDILHRKDFVKDFKALNGSNITENYLNNLDNPYVEPNTNNVEYYFSIQTDHMINKQAACKGMEIFNKDSYYIDIDFECEESDIDISYYDIYGPVTEPEICL